MQRNTWPVTVSVGAVTYSRAPATLDEAVHDADSLMYRSKADGKDRVSIEQIDAR
jgi:GGDEF domain-containing protein